MRALWYNLRKNWWLPVLWFAAWLIDVFTELFSSFLETWIPLTVSTLIFLVGIPVVLYVVVRLTRRQTTWVLVPREKQPPVHQGMIILVGTGKKNADPLETSVAPAMDYHLSSGENPLKVVWLLPSNPAVPVAEIFRDRYESDALRIELEVIDNEFSVQGTYQAVRQIYTEEVQKYGLKPENVISDFTGGTRMMTAGMVLACQDEFPMQYMSGKEKATSKPIFVQFEPDKDLSE